MPIDLYSQRNAPPCKELVYHYIKPECRRQIVNIAKAFFTENYIDAYAEAHVWPFIQSTLKDEHGLNSLHLEGVVKGFNGRVSSSSEVQEYLLKMDKIDKLLDIIEIIFRVISKTDDIVSKAGYSVNHYPPQKAIEALNSRLSQHCIGFMFEAGMIIKIDNETLYNTITREVMTFLSNPIYYNINEEYIQAHKHFRNGDYKDCIVNCTKAYESTLKIICEQKGYPYDVTHNVKRLLTVLYDNKFIPDYIQTNLSGLRATLEGGVSVIRNKTSAHGAGASIVDVSEELAAYSLNSAGSMIKFLLKLLER